jgi:hypothetical protein
MALDSKIGGHSVVPAHAYQPSSLDQMSRRAYRSASRFSGSNGTEVPFLLITLACFNAPQQRRRPYVLYGWRCRPVFIDRLRSSLRGGGRRHQTSGQSTDMDCLTTRARAAPFPFECPIHTSAVSNSSSNFVRDRDLSKAELFLDLRCPVSAP